MCTNRLLDVGQPLTLCQGLPQHLMNPDMRRCVPVLQAEKERRRVAKERKEVQQKKNLKMEKISNPATIKRMMKSKKQRKLLVTADPAA